MAQRKKYDDFNTAPLMEMAKMRAKAAHAAARVGGVAAPSAPPSGGLPSYNGMGVDLGVQRNATSNARAGQAFRTVLGGDGLEHHIYADGTDVAMKAPQRSGMENATLVKIAAAAQQQGGLRAPRSIPEIQAQQGEPVPDLSAVAALPPEQQAALAQLASAVAQQRRLLADNPQLMNRRARIYGA